MWHLNDLLDYQDLRNLNFLNNLKRNQLIKNQNLQKNAGPTSSDLLTASTCKTSKSKFAYVVAPAPGTFSDVLTKSPSRTSKSKFAIVLASAFVYVVTSAPFNSDHKRSAASTFTRASSKVEEHLKAVATTSWASRKSTIGAERQAD